MNKEKTIWFGMALFSVLYLIIIGALVGIAIYQKGRPICEEYALECNSKCVETLENGIFTDFHEMLYNNTKETGLYYGNKLNEQQIMRCCKNVN